MLGAGAEPGDEQRDHEQAEARARAGEAIAGADERRAERQHRRRAQALGDESGGNLEAGHGAGEQLAHRLAGDAHGDRGSRSLRSTKALLTNEITGSPRWFTPVLRTKIMPQPGRLDKGRISTTSVPYETVSPT